MGIGRQAACLVAVALLAAGCDTSTADYRRTQTLVVTQQPTALTLTLPEAGAELSRTDQERLHAFADKFLAKGDKPLGVVIADGPQASEQALLVSNLLAGLGLRAEDIDVRIVAGGHKDGETASNPVALLTFRSYVVQVPQCGDWTDHSIWSKRGAWWEYDNMPSASFGCATQRNLGLMVSNPRDLLRHRDVEGRDGARAAGIVGAYQQGKPSASEADVSGTLSKVGKK